MEHRKLTKKCVFLELDNERKKETIFTLQKNIDDLHKITLQSHVIQIEQDRFDTFLSDKYKNKQAVQEYEEKYSLHTQFRRKERERHLHQMSKWEGYTLQFCRLILFNEYIRNAFFSYIILSHVLIFLLIIK